MHKKLLLNKFYDDRKLGKTSCKMAELTGVEFYVK